MIEKLLIFIEKLLIRWKNRDSLKLFGAVRSPEWRKVRADHLKRQPCCMLCGGTETLEVHHIQPFHINPALELDPENLITLCESGKNGIVCHRAFGHLGNYQSVNTEVKPDTEHWHDKIEHRP